jgi:hypothetical protein
MKITFLLLFALGCASAPVTSAPVPPATSPAPQPPQVADRQNCALVGDRLYFGESNARAIFAKFETIERLSETLRLDAEVGRYEGRVWRLHDIMVTADFSSNGYNASWIVSAPEPLLTEYIARLQRGYADRSVIFDFSVSPYCIKPAFD